MQIRRHLTYANVMATLAVFGVLAGGGAYAASKIDTKQIANKAVTAKKLDSQAVKGAKLAPGAVTAGALGPGAVETANLSTDARGAAMAGAQVGESGQLLGWFNRFGDGPPQVERTGTGVYHLLFPGLESLRASVVHAATITYSPNTTGYPGGVSARMSGSCSGYCIDRPLINTFDSAGNPADLGFNYLMFKGSDFPQRDR